MPRHILKPNATSSDDGWTITGASANAAVTRADFPAAPDSSSYIESLDSSGLAIVFGISDPSGFVGTSTIIAVRIYATDADGGTGGSFDVSISPDGSTWQPDVSGLAPANDWQQATFRVAWNNANVTGLCVRLRGYGDDDAVGVRIRAIEVFVAESGTPTDTSVAPFLADLKLLVEADDQSVADGANVSVLLDGSGGENHCPSAGSSRATYHASVINGRGVIRFDGNNDFYDLPNMMAGLSSGEMFVVVKTAQADPPSDSNRTACWAFGANAADNSHYPFAGGNIYENFGSTARKNWDPTPKLDQFQVYNVYSAASDWQAFLGNVSTFSTGTNTVGWTDTPWIGKTFSAGFWFYGDIAAIIVYGRMLTTGERDDVYDYLNNKYFIAATTYVSSLGGDAITFNSFTRTQAGLHRMGYDPYAQSHAGLHQVFRSYLKSAAGAAEIRNAFAHTHVGQHKVIYLNYDQSAAGAAYFLNAFRQTHAGACKIIYLPYAQSHAGMGMVFRAYVASHAGQFAIYLNCTTGIAGEGRVANDALARYELFIGSDASPDFQAAAFETFTSLPHATAALSLPGSGTTRKYHLVVRQRNAWGLSSQNIIETIFEIDSSGNLVIVRPSAPIEIIATPSAAGTITITARYLYNTDGINQADKFLVYAGTAAVDFSTDTPVEVGIIKSDGIAKLTYTTDAFGEGDTVHVAVRTRRAGVSPNPDVDSNNTDTHSAIATLLGPAGQAGELFFEGAEKQAQ
jgi:hypothetical protein